MSSGQVYLPIIGRILVGAFFIFLAISHTRHWKSRADALRARNILMPTMVIWTAILLYFIGGALVVLHLGICSAVTLLTIMLIIRAVLFYNFWNKQGEEKRVSAIGFMMNIALVGALFLTI